MHRILIATHNKYKYGELQVVFADNELETVAAFEQGISDVEEGDVSYLDNARLKAEHGLKLSTLPTLGEDSGLEIPGLDNFPGVITKRFTDECGSYQSAVSHYLDRLGVETCEARYVADLYLALPGQQHISARGMLEGSLIRKPRGEGTFGYDPWFVPKGFVKTCAEISKAEKNRISHRGQALQQMIEKMKKHEFFRAVP